MSVSVPPWLEAADPASQWLKGVQVGSSIAEANARLSQEAQKANLEAAAQAQTFKQDTLMREAQMQTTNAYRQAEIGLQRDRLTEAKAVNDARLVDAAKKSMAQQKLSMILQSNPKMSMQDALLQVPELATPSAIMGAHRQDEDLGGQKMDLRQQELETRQRKLDLSEERLKASQEKPTRIGEKRSEQRDKFGNLISSSTDYLFGTPGKPPATPSAPKPLTQDIAKQFLQQAGGDKTKARQLAKDAGYSF